MVSYSFFPLPENKKSTKTMKKIIFMSVFTLVVLSSVAQSVSINPNSLQIPSVSALPACAAADYGKIVFLTTTNRANECSGSGWIEVATGCGGVGLLTWALCFFCRSFFVGASPGHISLAPTRGGGYIGCEKFPAFFPPARTIPPLEKASWGEGQKAGWRGDQPAALNQRAAARRALAP